MAQYTRQQLIEDIERHTGRRLICYIATPGALLERTDVSGFADLVDDLEPNSDVDLMINVYGGDVDAAHRAAYLIRKAVPQGTLRAVIPDSAKSAGTLLAIGTDRILMSDTSELGPIDPLVMVPGPAGPDVRRPAQTYITAFEEALTNAASNDPSASSWKQVLDTFDPASVTRCRQAVRRTKIFAEQVLRDGMFSAAAVRTGPGNWTQVAAALLAANRYGSHGAVITCDEACSIGLEVDHLPRKSDLWQAYWRLYCLQVCGLQPGEKLFESRRVSLPTS